MKNKAFKNPEVAAVFAAYPRQIKLKLLVLRQLIFDIGAETADDQIPIKQLGHCIALALTYHLDKKRSNRL